MYQSGMLEKLKFSWRLTAHRRPLGRFKEHAGPSNSVVFQLNYGELSVTSSMGLDNFLDDQKYGYENGG